MMAMRAAWVAGSWIEYLEKAAVRAGAAREASAHSDAKSPVPEQVAVAGSMAMSCSAVMVWQVEEVVVSGVGVGRARVVRARVVVRRRDLVETILEVVVVCRFGCGLWVLVL